MIFSPRIREFFWLPLLPVTFLWTLVVYLRRRFLFGKGYRSPLRTVCIGNLHAGGTGKTPLVAQLARVLSSWSPVIVSRGYRGKKSAEGAWVDLAQADAWIDFGDEPVYLARATQRPVRIGRDRALSAKAVEAKYPGSLLLLDDGFQNFGLRHDVDIVVLPEGGEWSDRYCHPTGPLREPASALKHATAAVIVAAEAGKATRWRPYLAARHPALPVFEVRPTWGGLFDSGNKYALDGQEKFGVFCGIARPERFFSVIQSLFPSQTRLYKAFPDHHAFTEADLRALLVEGKNQQVSHWITTEKDLVRLKPEVLGTVLTARVEYDIPEDLVDLIQKELELS